MVAPDGPTLLGADAKGVEWRADSDRGPTVAIVRFLYLLALAVWLGEIVFFSFVVAPAIFGVLGAARAGPVLAAIFPRYYAIGAAAAAVALGCATLLGRRSGSGWWGGVVG